MSVLKFLSRKSSRHCSILGLKRWSSTGCSHINARVIENDMKKEIEEHWRGKLDDRLFDRNNLKDKFYVLSMFPYPSGNLHMGHVRVYTISDAIARFHRLNGKNVLHPMGWDAFGLPAENAAIQRQISAEEWTKQNIAHMKEQLDKLGCSFDWKHELSTCDPLYYKWTQKLFLMLYNDGLVYQCEASVNWDPIDKTVLADEQVDANGHSWRSGAKVEKKLLKQWFVKTTKFSEQLYNGLSDPILQDWRGIVKVQKHWIGKSDGWNFELTAGNQPVTVWTKSPQDLIYAGFIAIKKDHRLNVNKIEEGVLDIMIKNPFGVDLKIIVTKDVEFPPNNDVYIGVPIKKDSDFEIAQKHGIQIESSLPIEESEEDQSWVLEKAQELGIGGSYKVSSKLRDWLISRQRYWGAPIPIIHCSSCGAVPLKDEDLPVKLPEFKGKIGEPLHNNEEWLKCSCPKCGADARRETDTMDTFVDSSWYFLRYLNPENTSEMINKDIAHSMMPVDIYVGGKEHAELHLYYARFINHYLYQKGLVPHPEPFKRLLVQGMVRGKSFRLKESGQYLKSDEVEIIDEKKGKGVEKSSGKPVTVMWEKMSKSKFNGVDPTEIIDVHGCDTTRLIMLADVAPASFRNWSDATFPGVINWQRRIWLTIYDLHLVRERADEITKSETFNEQEEQLLDAVNFYTSQVTFNYKYSHQLSVAISKMHGLTNSIRRASNDVVCFGENYERALAAQIIMMAPMAPHFASELWTRFTSAKNRVTGVSKHIDWNSGVFSQKWPKVDPHHQVKITININNQELTTSKVTCGELNSMSEEQATKIALSDQKVVEVLTGKTVLGTFWRIDKDYQGILTFKTDLPVAAEKEDVEEAAN